jgi:signal transduction histidine kinase
MELWQPPAINYVIVLTMTQQDELASQSQEIEALRAELQRERELRLTKSSFTAMIAHEFGTPLSVIRAKNDLLSMHLDQFPKERIIQYLHQIEDQVNHMVELLDDLVFINRADSKKSVFQPEQLDLRPFCEKLLDHIALRWGRDEINFAASGDVNNVALDRRLMGYMLSNLVSNALKYSAAGSGVHVTIDGREKDIIFSVRDYGIGITPEDIDRIFTPFFRASNARIFSGMGLGLAIVKSGVEACGGSIQVESRLGEGTVFVVTLPREG